MFDIAGTELFLLIVLAIIFVGPKDLPRLMRSIGAFIRKARAVARDFQRSLEDIANEADLQDLQKGVQDIKGIKDDAAAKLKSTIDPFDTGKKKPSGKGGKAK